MSKRSHSWNSDVTNFFVTPAALLGLWNPFLIGLAQFNERSADGMSTLFSEWHSFMAHRLAQDMQLMLQLAKCSSPHEGSAVYADFWQKAFGDYTKELSTMNKLFAGITSKAISHAYSASEEAAKTTHPSTAAV